MATKIGPSGQIINFNYVNEFVSENLNKLLYSTFSPGVLEFTYTFTTTEFVITKLSALLHPKDQEFSVKVDTMDSVKIVVDPAETYLVASMDWLTPPNGYEYDSTSYGTPGASGYSGYSGYFFDPIISCQLNSTENEITSSYHNLVVGDVIRFETSIAGVTTDTDYYVVEIVSPNAFMVSETAGGTAVTLISVGSQTILSNSYRKMNTHIVRLETIKEEDFDSTYHILLAELWFNKPGALISVDVSNQTQVYLADKCINYDTVQYPGESGWLGISGFSEGSPRTLTGTNPDYIEDAEGTHYSPGHVSGCIPINDGVLSLKLNAQYLNGVAVGNNDNNIGLNNGILSKNMVAARLFLNSYDYGIGQSGIEYYSGYSGYDVDPEGTSGFSAYSGYIPVSNTVLQTNLNAEYFGGYKLSEFSASGHTHSLDDIVDGTTFKRVYGVGSNGLVTTEGIYDGALKYTHQSLTNPFRYDDGVAAKIFMLTGEIEKNGSTQVTFRKTFASAPKVFLLNNETDEWKAVKEADITTTTFTITHTENTSGTSLAADSTYFSTHWLAVGSLVE